MSSGEYIDEALKKFDASIVITSKNLYSLLRSVLYDYVEKGILQPDSLELARLEEKILNALAQSGYGNNVEDLLKAFPDLEEINEKYYQKAEKLSAKNALKGSQRINEHVKQVIDQLRGGGAKEGILKPIENLIRQQILLKRPVKEVEILLRNEIISNNLLGRYAGQIAVDALSQFDGIINDEVRVKYDLKNFFYIGSLIETSRPICDHIRDTYKSAISINNLDKILDEFCPNGIPSEEKISYETVNKKKVKAKKGSGMYKGTNSGNFSTYRGGYGCRHEVKWTRRSQ